MDGTRRSRSTITRTSPAPRGGTGEEGGRADKVNARAPVVALMKQKGHDCEICPFQCPDAKMLITLLWSRLFLAHAPATRHAWHGTIRAQQGTRGHLRNRKDGLPQVYRAKRTTREVLRKRAQTVRRRAALFCDAWKEFFFFSFYLIRSNARKIADEKSGWQRSAWLSVFHCVHGLLNFGYQGEKQ